MENPIFLNVFRGKTIRYRAESDSFFLGDFVNGADMNYVAPLSVGWIITGKCNLKCIHCYGNEEELPSYETTEAEAMTIAVKIVKEGIRRVSISGGEPMLRKDLPAIVDYLADNGVWVIVSSNGLNVSNVLPQLKKLRHIEISLDGSTEAIHDYIRPARIAGKAVSFRNAVSGITAAVDMGIRTRILTTINMFNRNDLREIGALISKLWVQEWHIGKTTNAGRARFVYKSLMEKTDFDDNDLEGLRVEFPTLKIQFNYPSKSSKYYALILPDGQMATQDYFSWEKIALGSLVQNSFRDFWNEDGYDIVGHYYKWLNLNPETA